MLETNQLQQPTEQVWHKDMPVSHLQETRALGKVQPWKGVKPKVPSPTLETIRHEFKEGEVILDFGHRGCAVPLNI